MIIGLSSDDNGRRNLSFMGLSWVDVGTNLC